MKKLFLFTLVLVVTLSMTSCSKKDDSSDNSEDTSTTQAETQSETEESTNSPEVMGTEDYPYAKPNVPKNLSNKADSFQISLDGNVVKLPALYSDFVKLGWTCDAIDGEKLKPGFLTIGNASLQKGKTSFNVSFINLGDKELPLSECHIYSVNISYGAIASVDSSIVLPGGLHLASTKDEIIAAYGQPSETDDSSSSKTILKYTFSENDYISFELDNENKYQWNRIIMCRQDGSLN